VGRIALLDRETMRPGEEGFVQFRLEEPVVVGHGDYFVARLASPMWTIGGGRVAGTSPARLRRMRPETLEELKASAAAFDRPEARAEAALRRFGDRSATLEEWGAEAKEPAARLAPMLEALCGAGRAVVLPGSKKAIHVDGLRRAREALARILERFHAANPLRLGMERQALRAAARLDPEVFDGALGAAVAAGALAEGPGGILRLASFSPKLGREDEAMAAEIEKLLRETRFASPGRKEVAARFPKATPDKVGRVLRLLADQGTIVLLKDDVLLHREAVEEARRLLVQALQAQGEVESAKFRDLLGTTRKYVIPLLEHFDETGLTRREGNKRFLKK
jgi:selenocysteine-specific elongation factor